MASLGSTTVTLAAVTRGFQKDMLRASRIMRRFGREASRATRSAARVATGLAFGTAGLGAVVNHLSQSATSLRELSIASGIAIPTLQGLQRTLEADGVAAETFRKSIVTLQRNLGNAAQGDLEYLESFERLGVSLRNAEGDIRATEDVLFNVLESLAEVPPSLSAAFASDIFGRGGKEILTIIERIRNDTDFLNKDLARQAELLPALTTTAATELKAVNQAFTDAGNAAETYGQILIASIGPEIVAGIESALRAIKDNSERITSALRAVAVNLDLIFGAALLLSFRRVAFAIGGATLALLRFGAVMAVTGGAGGIKALISSIRLLGGAVGVIAKQVFVAVAGFGALLYTANLVRNAIEGQGVDFGLAFDDTLGQIQRAIDLFSDIVGDTEDLPVIHIEAQADTTEIEAIQAQVRAITAEPQIIRVQAETFGLADQVNQLENQRDLLLASGDEAVRLAARQQFLANVQRELSASYDQLQNAQEKLAEGGPNLDPEQASNYRDEIETLVNRIDELNAITIDPNFNSNVIDEISNLNQQIAEISGKRQAEISVDMTVNFGNNLEMARQQLESELALLQDAARGNISFGVAEQMQIEVNAAIGELNNIRNRIRQNERLLNLMPDIDEAAKLNAELVRLRSLAATIEFNIRNPEVLQQAAGEVVNLKNEIAALQRRQEFARSAADSFTSALGGMITGSQTGSEAVKGLITSLANLVLQYTVLIPLAQSLATAFGATGLVGIGGIGAAATGGFHRGLTVVGERGPELVDFGGGAQVYTNDQLAAAVGGGGGQQIVVNNNINIDSTDGPGVQRALAEALPALTDASVNRIMSESSRPGQVRTVLRGY